MLSFIKPVVLATVVACGALFADASQAKAGGWGISFYSGGYPGYGYSSPYYGGGYGYRSYYGGYNPGFSYYRSYYPSWGGYGGHYHHHHHCR